MTATAFSEDDYNHLDMLLEDLRASGFLISPDIQIKVTSVLLNLTSNGLRPRSSQRLSQFLAPLVCRSAEEQSEFYRIFSYWFPDLEYVSEESQAGESVPSYSMDDAFRSAKAAAELEADQHRREREIHELKKSVRRLAPVMAFAFLLTILLRILLPEPVDDPIEGGKTGNEVENCIDAADVNCESGNGRSGLIDPPRVNENPGGGGDGGVAPPATSPTNALVEFFRSLQSSMNVGMENTSAFVAATENTLGPASTLVLMIPFAIFALLLASSRRLLNAYASRTEIRTRSDFRRLLSQDSENFGLVNKRFYGNVQPLRRRITTHSRDLDLEETVLATAASGGQITPRFAFRMASPEYIILIDRRSQNDHSTELANLFVNHLSTAGVYTSSYFFDRDPRRVTLAGNRSTLYLDELLRPSETTRIVVFSDLEGFSDSALGKPRDFCRDLFSNFPTVLVSIKPIQDWGRAEFLIERESDAPIVPASHEGLKNAADYFDPENSKWPKEANAYRSIFPDRSRLTGRFAVGVWKWIGEIEPEKEVIDDLVAALESELSKNTWLWLRALAVYPLLYWSLTLYLGRQLYMPSERNPVYTEEGLRDLVRLPWLVRGRMPSWLRRRLISELSLDQRSQVREILEKILLTAVTRTRKDTVLGISSARKDASTENLRQREPENDDLATDSILVNFMTSTEASEEDFGLASRIAASLGIPRAGSILKSFSGKKEKDAMLSSLRECQRLTEDYPPERIEISPVGDLELGHNVSKINEYISSSSDVVKLSREYFLFRYSPNQKEFVLADEFALKMLKERTALVWKFYRWTLLVIVSLLVVRYFDYFRPMEFLDMSGNGNEDAAVAQLFISIIFLIPYFVYRWLIYRPFRKLFKKFPKVKISLVKSRRVKK